MKFIKKNKYTIIAVLIFIGLVFIGAKAKNILVPDTAKAAYGDRLDGIKNHPLTDDTLKSISSKLEENENILKATANLQGKIINVIISVNDTVSVNDAKTMASSVIELFTKDELSFYTLQVFVKKENQDLNNFPIIGYKDNSSDTMYFTKDREITEGASNEK